MLQDRAILIIFFQSFPSDLSGTGNNFIKLFFLSFTSPTLSDTPLFYIKVVANNGSSHQVAKVLELPLQHQSFQ